MFDWHKATGKAYITSGTGYGKTELSAFDAAELNANILAANAVKASSFVPPNWQVINSNEELGRYTDNGAFLPMAYSYAVSNQTNVAASLIIGINKDTTKASVIVEHADVNITKNQSLEQSMSCLEEALESRGWQIDRLEKAAVEGVPRKGLYICALVAVVFVIDHTNTIARADI
jgi:arginine decarboxylase